MHALAIRRRRRDARRRPHPVQTVGVEVGVELDVVVAAAVCRAAVERVARIGRTERRRRRRRRSRLVDAGVAHGGRALARHGHGRLGAALHGGEHLLHGLVAHLRVVAALVARDAPVGAAPLPRVARRRVLGARLVPPALPKLLAAVGTRCRLLASGARVC